MKQPAAHAFLASVRIGDIVAGVVTEIARSSLHVRLDGTAGRPLGVVGPLDVSWSSAGPLEERFPVGRRVTGEVTAVEPDEGVVRLALTATEHPELWTYLTSLHEGAHVTGTVAAIERFGVFVDLDDGPRHPVYPGVGFLTLPELSWTRLDAPTDAVTVGQHVTCVFLGFDRHQGEARLSLRALRPDPMRLFARAHPAGAVLRGTVTKVVPFGVFVRVADGLEGLVHRDQPGGPGQESAEVGCRVDVVLAGVDPERRRISLGWR